MNANLYDLFERHFPDAPEQPVLLVPQATSVSYGDLAGMSARMAHALVAAGCQPGDRVAVQGDKHWQVLALYLFAFRGADVAMLALGHEHGVAIAIAIMVTAIVALRVRQAWTAVSLEPALDSVSDDGLLRLSLSSNDA